MVLFSKILGIEASTPATLAKTDNVILFRLMDDVIKELHYDLRTVFRLYEAYHAMLPYEWFYEYKVFASGG